MSQKKKRKLKHNIKLDITFLIIIIACIGLIISGYQIYNWYQDNNKVNKQVQLLEDKAEVKEVSDTEKTELVNPVFSKKDPYWDYIKTKFIDVDLNDLRGINPDVVGWLQVYGTNINYPVVQTTNNSYYLTHQLDKKKNSAGWVFMDYRNHVEEFDKNTIIYAYGRVNNTMFGSLRKVITDSWYRNPKNYIVRMSTNYENTVWQVFSTYKIKTTSDYTDVMFNDDREYTDFLNMLKRRSVHNYNVDLTPSDKIITLSTCYDNKYKVVLHAKLIKREVIE